MSEHRSIDMHLGNHWLSWIALRHFLTAPLLRALMEVMVSKASKNQVKFSDLFEDYAEHQAPNLESWGFFAKSVSGELAVYLQRRVQYFLWQNDGEAYPPDFMQNNPELGGPYDVEAAVEFGARDFSTDDRGARPIRGADPSLVTIAGIMRDVRHLVLDAAIPFFSEKVMIQAKELEWPLSTVVIKHFGDLCADADRWGKAQHLYAEAESLIPPNAGPWSDYVQALRDILVQSKAAAAMVVDGPERAEHILSGALAEATLRSHPILVMNAPYDSLIASVKSGNTNFRDQLRGTLLSPPLYSGTHDLATALSYSNENKFSDAQRLFWSVLRRQIALGLAGETRSTKFAFGRGILRQLQYDDRRRASAGDFMLAVRLLIESGDSNALKVLTWPEPVLKEYLNAGVVDGVIQITTHYPKNLVERQKAVVEIFRAWISVISDDRREVAGRMLRVMAELAGEGKTAFFSNVDVGGRALEVLEELADSRPEFKRLISNEIYDIILKRLGRSDGWQAQQKALKLALTFIEVFSDSQARFVVDATLALLGNIDPTKQVWPLTQPALELLSSKTSSKLSRSAPDLGRAVVETILKFGNEQSSESAALLFRLRDFDVKLLSDPSIIASVQPAVAEVKRGVDNINSSAAVGNIQALLLSPTVSGRDGVDSALQSLLKILATPRANNVSMSLTYAYAPILMLVDKQAAFVQELHMPEAEVGILWSKIYSLITDLWAAATVRPTVLAEFSIPRPTKPNPVVVHNWAFASLRFAQSVGRREEMVATLEAAMNQHDLQEPIATALATGTGQDASVDIDPDSIGRESREVFYSALGRRLAVLSKLPEDRATVLCEALLRQCLRYGPRDIDAAVLGFAVRAKIGGAAKEELGENYGQRASATREYRMSILPLLVNMGVDVQ